MGSRRIAILAGCVVAMLASAPVAHGKADRQLLEEWQALQRQNYAEGVIDAIPGTRPMERGAWGKGPHQLDVPDIFGPGAVLSRR